MRLLEEAMELQAAGDLAAAVEAYNRALTAALPSPLRQAVRHNLGVALRGLGRLEEAKEAFAAAIDLAPEDAGAWSGLGLVHADLGEPELAVKAHRTALALGPAPASWVRLGNALRSAGDRRGAAEAFRAAIVLDPEMAAAHYNLHAAIYDEADPAPALASLDRALVLGPDHVFARFFRHALARWHGEPSALSLPAEAAFLGESLDLVLGLRCPSTRMFADTFETLRYSTSIAPARGAIVELGVRRGTSLRFLAGLFPGRSVHGFDSFEGLPEDWGGQPAGLYSTGGRLPEVPDHVVLHAGWFAETVPALATRVTEPVALVHVDCDLYCSTREALDALSPRLGRGAVLVFDDYLCNPGWRDEEHRALSEVAAERSWSLRYAAFSLFSRQAVVVIEN